MKPIKAVVISLSSSMYSDFESDDIKVTFRLVEPVIPTNLTFNVFIKSGDEPCIGTVYEFVERLHTHDNLSPIEGRHPMQKLTKCGDGVTRFTKNHIVEYLLHKSDLGLNDLALIEFSPADREQFAQLIGYSVDGYCDLSYVSDESRQRLQEILDD